MHKVNDYMDTLETDVCLALARFYDSPPQTLPERISEPCDPTPEECATKDAPVWEENRQIERHA